MNFKDFDLKISYKNLGEEGVSSIINPLLGCTKIYKRSVGFFSSSSLDFIGQGILSLARNDNSKIMLCTSPRLNEEDIRAIKLGYDFRTIVEERTYNDLDVALENLSEENARILFMLIKENILDVKIVCKDNGIYHDKLAVLEDYSGNVIAFVGSSNETRGGYHDNYEKVRVYKSWTDTEGRIDDEIDEFMSIWNNDNEFLEVIDFNQAFENKILNVINNKSNMSNNTTKNIYEMRDYQIEAKNNWIGNHHNGFFVMATGTGKTITSLFTIKEFIEVNKILTIIAVPYKHLVNQWYEDVKIFYPDAMVIMVHGEIKNCDNKIYSSYIAARNEYKPVIIITTIKSFFIEKYEKIYNEITFDKLLIVDEAHNFVTKISDELSSRYKYKLGLSATPVFGNDIDKTNKLIKWFGGIAMDFPIEKAIGKYLVNYEYHPIFIQATTNDEENFMKAHQLMLSAIDQENGMIIDEEKFTIGYRGRLRAISMAEGKTKLISSIFSKVEDKKHLIIYCSDGKLFYEKKHEKLEIRHLEFMLKLINNSLVESNNSKFRATKFTASEDVKTRMELIDRFNKGYDDILVAIKCLDEGINIPSIKSALILSSNDNYREFVQRRGRILRLYKGKKIAHIYDVIVIPSINTPLIAEIEFRRFYEYARLAINFEEIRQILEDKMYDFNLTYDDIKFKNDYVYGGDLDD